MGVGLRPAAKAPEAPPTPYRPRASSRLYYPPRARRLSAESPRIPGLIPQSLIRRPRHADKGQRAAHRRSLGKLVLRHVKMLG